VRQVLGPLKAKAMETRDMNEEGPSISDILRKHGDDLTKTGDRVVSSGKDDDSDFSESNSEDEEPAPKRKSSRSAKNKSSKKKGNDLSGKRNPGSSAPGTKRLEVRLHRVLLPERKIGPR